MDLVHGSTPSLGRVSIERAMNEGHDQPSGSPAPSSAMDVLSDVLRSIHLSGSMLFLVDAVAPWVSWAPRRRGVPACRAAGFAAPGVVSHHHPGTMLGGAARRAARALRRGRHSRRAAWRRLLSRQPARCRDHLRNRRGGEFFLSHGCGRVADGGGAVRQWKRADAVHLRFPGCQMRPSTRCSPRCRR